MTSLLQDLKFALRLLAKAPGFTVAAVAVLAIGIGLNTAIFSTTYSLAFSPRPFAEPERVVQLYTHDRKEPTNYRAFSYPIYRALAQRTDLFSGVLAHNLTMVGIGEKGEARRSFSSIVSANYFALLGVPLAKGRPFTPEEERPGAEAQVVIASHQYWKRTGFDPQLVGSTIRINERPFTVIGITPEGFSGTMMLVGPELYFPLSVFSSLSNDFDGPEKRTLERADTYNLFLVARLADGVSREAATAALGALGQALETDFPAEFREKTVSLGTLPRLSTSTSPSEESTISLLGIMLLSMSGAVLLVVCLNLAGLLLARGQARRKEFAIRLALGGGRARLVRQLCVEGGVLALAGGGLGFLLASTANSWLAAALSMRLPVTLFLSPNASPAIIGASLAFCVLATVFFALGPALKLSRTDVLTDLKGQPGEGTPTVRRRWLPRHPLVVTQIALSLALLVAASLFVRMALRLAETESGVSADNTVVVEVDSSLGGFDETQGRHLFNAINGRLAALPGVQSASVGAIIPFGMVHIGRAVQRAGVNPPADAKPVTAAEGLAFDARWNAVGADYFATLGLPLLRGRAFSAAEAESPGAPAVAIIDEVLARKLWPEGDALGQRIQWADAEAPRAASNQQGGIGEQQDIAARAHESRLIEIVGIARATRDDFGQKEAGNSIYVPFAQGFRHNVHFHVRPAQDSAAAAVALLDPVRRAVREAAPGVPMFKVQTYRQHVDGNLEAWMTRLGSTLFAFFGVVSMLVAVLGIYGVKAYSVSRRTREIGVRMALGAHPGAVRAMILREGATIAASGIGLGLLLALATARAMSALFVDVAAFDLPVFAAAAVAFGVAALCACWIPAARATKINPLDALRAE
ncbi:MAG: ABC transporter permease [Candidatus Didemnitutus sp.]|nr:ABC transporter permease [Candidatus Didemnitutus sp.]